jgi:hypothetical protein
MQNHRYKNPGKGNRVVIEEVTHHAESLQKQSPALQPASDVPPVSELLPVVLKKIFRWKTLPLLTNYLIRKAGLSDSLRHFEDMAFTKLNNFFQR